MLAGASGLAGVSAQAPSGAVKVEQGTFRILVDGQQVGQEEFEIERQENTIQARGRLRLDAQGQHIEETSTLTLSLTYEPRSYEWKRTQPPGQFLKARFEGTKATLELSSGDTELVGREFLLEDTRVAVLDNNLFHHYLFLVRQYDFSRGGPQPVRILIPQEALPALVTLEDNGLHAVAAKPDSPTLRRLRMTSEDNEVWLWLDDRGRLVRISVPGVKVEVVRSP